MRNWKRKLKPKSVNKKKRAISVLDMAQKGLAYLKPDTRLLIVL